jgi:hypothetical protein
VTNSPFDRLMTLLPPPAGEVARVPWQLSRAEIGLDFPADYRQFADRYGSGRATRSDGFINVAVFSPDAGEHPFAGGTGFTAVMANQAKGIYPGFVFDGADEYYWGGTVYPVQPDPGGLLAWGENNDGDIFFWLTEDPDRWPVVMWARGPATTFRYEGGMVDFLLSVLTGAHPDITWLSDPTLTWTMSNDWLHRLH